MITTLGASAGAFTSHWGGNGTSEGRTLVTFSGFGSAIGSTVRSNSAFDDWLLIELEHDVVIAARMTTPLLIAI
jgi:hypothetical protein